MTPMQRREALGRFYALLAQLAEHVGGPRRLAEASAQSGWPPAGVYFFFEPDEVREDGGRRVVRVGSHALTETSRTTLWNRLSQHRGTATGTGNHRGSIFRLHVGTALLNRGEHPEAAGSWSHKGRATPERRTAEDGLERAVSAYIGAMPVLWLAVDDRHERALIEEHAIALLSNADRPAVDPASPAWLGHLADRAAVRRSHLWNVRHVDDAPDDAWLEVLQRRVEAGGGS
jgi:hypothetical protein